MEFLTALWIPIVVSAVAVFVASSIIWMATPLHKNDFRGTGAAEDGLLDAIKRAGLKAGVYVLPWCHGKDQKDPAVQAKMKANPPTMLTILAGPPNMGKMLGSWMAHLLIVSTFVAYIVWASGLTSPALAPGQPVEMFWPVFRMAAITSFLAYGGYALPMSIWHGQPWSQVPGRVLDGVIYAAVTGGIFGWLGT